MFCEIFCIDRYHHSSKVKESDIWTADPEFKSTYDFCSNFLNKIHVPQNSWFFASLAYTFQYTSYAPCYPSLSRRFLLIWESNLRYISRYSEPLKDGSYSLCAKILRTKIHVSDCNEHRFLNNTSQLPNHYFKKLPYDAIYCCSTSSIYTFFHACSGWPCNIFTF